MKYLLFLFLLLIAFSCRDEREVLYQVRLLNYNSTSIYLRLLDSSFKVGDTVASEYQENVSYIILKRIK